MDGTKTDFDFRTPTQEELDYCVHVKLTKPQPWDPYTFDLKLKSISCVFNPCRCKIHQQVSSISISHVVGDRYDYSYNELQIDETILHDI